MDLNQIDAAIESYVGTLSEQEIERLRFLRGLMEVQAQHAEKTAANTNYVPLSEALLEEGYRTEKPAFLLKPVAIDPQAFVYALQDCSCYLVDKGGLVPETDAALRFFDWMACVERSDLTLAGSDPTAYIASVCETEQTIDGESSSLPSETLALVLAFALRPMLESAARTVMDSFDHTEVNENYNRPVACPACGSHASAAAVGPTPSGAPNGKMNYCAICGTTWEFERIRCANCGTQNQGKLHYFNLEGDNAHRLYLCDDCGSYTRTVFREDLPARFCFEVEDAVMAKLDMVANDERFRP